MKRAITVWNKPHIIEVYQKSKSVWVAVGEYMGAQIEVKGRSESQATNAWREAAGYKGN